MYNGLKHYKVIIIGAGPAGVGAAVALAKQGLDSILIIERNKKIGGIPSFYEKKKGGVRTFIRWTRGGFPVFGEEYADWLNKKLIKTGAEIRLQSNVIDIESEGKSIVYVNPKEGKVELTADAIIMACGSREKNQAERGYLAGSRPARVLFGKQLLNFLNQGELPFKKPVIIGSDLIAYATAAKLRKAGAQNAIIVDIYNSPKCSFFERLYFRIWCKPDYQGKEVKSIEILGEKVVSGISINGITIPCDGIVICGDLIPNSELALQGSIKVDIRSRLLDIGRNGQLSVPGWFATGNILGGFHGAEWCYFNGAKVAKQVIKYVNI